MHAETISVDFDLDYSNQLEGFESKRFNNNGKIAPKGFIGTGLLSAPFLFIGNLLNNLIPNNWIRLIGAGKGGYFLISSKREEEDLHDISEQRGIRGIFKASISDEGIKSFQI